MTTNTNAALVAALEAAHDAIISMKVEAETAAQGDEQMMLDACEQISNEGLAASEVIRAALSTAAAQPPEGWVTVPVEPTEEMKAALTHQGDAHELHRRSQAYRGRITPQSIELGKTVARMTEKAVARLAAEGDPDERCSTCALRRGTPANQCADTLMDAMKCIVEDEPFFCHDKKRKGHACHGWFACAVATQDMPAIKVPWPFSHEDAP